MVTDAMMKTCRSSLLGRPALPRAIIPPAAWNTPSSAHSWASTNTAARNPTTGRSRVTLSTASRSGRAPITITAVAAGRAAMSSVQPFGRTNANASTTASSASETISKTSDRQ